MAINSVTISGNLARDAELRQTGSGMSVANFTVAVNERRKNKQTGEYEDVPQWVGCTLLGSRAEKLAQYLTKGTRIAVQGKLHYSQWETKDGQKRSTLDVTVDELMFMSRSDGNGGGQQQNYQPRQQYQQPQQQHFQRPQPRPNYQPGQQTISSVEQDAIPDVYDAGIPF